MRIARILLSTIPVAGVTLGVVVAGSPAANANPQVQGCVNASGVSACTNFNVPNINAVANAIPNISVPNINVPHVLHGHY